MSPPPGGKKTTYDNVVGASLQWHGEIAAAGPTRVVVACQVATARVVEAAVLCPAAGGLALQVVAAVGPAATLVVYAFITAKDP